MSAPDLTELLYSASGEAPPSRIDLGQILATGRRRRLRRRVLAPVAASLAVIGVALLSLALPGRPTTVALPPPASVPVAVPEAPMAFDPMVLQLSVVRPWATARPPTVLSSAEAQAVVYAEPMHDAAADAVQPATVWIVLYAFDRTPWQLNPAVRAVTGAAPTTSPGPSVQGVAAQWIAFDHDRDVSLLWRWAPGAWAVVEGKSTSSAVSRDLLRTVAASLRTDEPQPLRLPFELTPPVDPLRLVTIDEDRQEFSLRFATPESIGAPGPIDAGARVEAGLTVSALFEAVPASAKGATFATAGHLAEWSPGLLRVYDVSGYTLTLTAAAGRVATFSQADAAQLAGTVSVLGPPTDRTQWTTTPLR